MRSTPTWSAKIASKTEASTSSGSSVASGVEASAAVAMVSAAHPAMPATKSPTRTVPRSRIVALRAPYSSCSRPVMVLGASADTYGVGSHPLAVWGIVAQDLGGHVWGLIQTDFLAHP
jgi:hypothetical protein